MSTDRILTLGGGGIGGLVAANLTEAGRDVTLVDQWPENVEEVRRSGMHVTDGRGERSVPLRALHVHELQAEPADFDLVFLAVKSYDTEWFAHLARRHLTGDGCVVVCQNGITDQRVASVVGVQRTVGCVVTVAGSLDDAGRVRRADTYPVGFRVGELTTGLTRRVEELADLLTDVAVTRPTANLAGERWAKLGTNCMVNALSGLSGYTASEVRSRDDTLAIMMQLGAETINVARALGIDVSLVMGLDPQRFVDAAAGIGADALVDDLRTVAKAAGGHRASMLQDVIKGRRTEIEDLNGFVARQGAALGVKTPYNAAAAEVVRAYPVGAVVATADNITSLLDRAQRG